MTEDLTRRRWHVDKRALPPEDLPAFQSIYTLLDTPGEQVTLDKRSGVSRLSLSREYYAKRFVGRGSRLKFMLGISRYQRELRNLGFFSSLGLATPDLIACGYELRMGLLHRAALVTAGVEQATDLKQFIEAGRLYEDGVAGVRRILRSLARAARLLHSNNFYHKDLKTRNILIQKRCGEIELFFFDCPSGHHPPRFLQRRGVVRDLASLEEGLRGRLRRVDLLYLYKQYRGCTLLGTEDKALARDALAYHGNRRMTRKRRQREASKARNTSGMA